MKQVKIFTRQKAEDLEWILNTWLKREQNKTGVLDIKFSASHYGCSAMIIYETK